MAPTDQTVYVLISFAYWNDKIGAVLREMAKDHDLRLLIDSGAFTAFRTGRVFTMDKYCAFLDALPVKPEGYFMLDVIGDEEATRANYMEMLKRGYDPIPVVTYTAAATEIEFYYQHTDLISFGALQFLPFNDQVHRLTEFSNICAGRKYHILGLTGARLLKHFRPYSCDASTISAPTRFGNFKTYIANGHFKGHHRNDLVDKPAPEIVRACDDLKIDIKDAGKEENWRGSKGVTGLTLNVYAYMKYAYDVRRKLGTKMYMACVQDREVAAIKYVADTRRAQCA